VDKKNMSISIIRNKRRKAMSKALFRSAAVVAVMVSCLALSAFAAEQTDVGQADKAALEKVHPTKPPAWK
jgi:hypothetical protein